MVLEIDWVGTSQPNLAALICLTISEKTVFMDERRTNEGAICTCSCAAGAQSRV